ncbi:hypothetical protein [Pseudomonas putida]
MSLSMTILTMIAAWLAIALAMLWGILRIARRRVPAPGVRAHRVASSHAPASLATSG